MSLTDFPAAIDTFPAIDAGAGDQLNTVTKEHDDGHNKATDAIEALQTKVGVDGSTDADSLDRKAALLVEVFINVKKFGAVGDGTTDDRAAIQSAIDSFGVVGGFLWFPRGRYRITAALYGASNVTCFGIYGGIAIPPQLNNGTQILWDGAAPPATTIAVASNGAVLPQATINVASTSAFPAAGLLLIPTGEGPDGFEQIRYTGKTGTTFTGCTGGFGTLATSAAVKQQIAAVNAFSVQQFRLDGICIDGGANGATDVVIGMLFDSDNSPSTYMCGIDHFWIQRTYCAIQIGSGHAGANNYQVDKINVGEGTLYANTRGMIFDSDNAADASTIGGGTGTITIDAYQVGVEVRACGEMTFDSIIFGGYFPFPLSSRAVTDLATTNGSTQITSTLAAWTDADIGATFNAFGGATSNAGIAAYYQIVKVSGTSAWLNRPATATATGNATIYRWGIDFWISTPNHNPITIRNCQAEGNIGIALRVGRKATTTNVTAPITLGPSNVLGKLHLISQQCIVRSGGNMYTADFVLNATLIHGSSDNDGWWDPVALPVGPGFVYGPDNLYSTMHVTGPTSIAQAFGPVQVLEGAKDAAQIIDIDGTRFQGRHEVPTIDGGIGAGVYSGTGVPGVGNLPLFTGGFRVGDMYIRIDGGIASYIYRCTVAGYPGTWVATAA